MALSEKQRAHLEKVRLGNIGRKCPESTKIAVALANKGKVAWNRGKKNPYSSETLLRMSLAKKGKRIKDSHRANMSRAWTLERRKKLGEKNSLNLGWKNPNWRGGKTKEIKSLRSSPEYRKWRKFILSRDGNRCVLCGSSERIETDHIVSIHDDVSMALDLDNGRVLCHECHKSITSYGTTKKT